MPDDLDVQVRRYDEDRWLASRFAPRGVRSRLIAVYALNHEIARTADVVTQPAIGDIRFAWWREAIEEVAAGKPPRPHPVLEAFAAARTDRSPLAVWDRLIAARGKDLDARPFETWRELEDYVDATTGGVMRAALAASGQDAVAHEPLVAAGAQAWGLVGLLRTEPHWRAKGRVLLPREGGAFEELAARAHAAIAAARTAEASAAIFPALGYVALARDYLRAHDKGAGAPLLFTRQLKLIAAAATGRL
jgi:phytoene synthase